MLRWCARAEGTNDRTDAGIRLSLLLAAEARLYKYIKELVALIFDLSKFFIVVMVEPM